MTDNNGEFDDLIRLHGEIDSFLVNKSEEILNNYLHSSEAKFVLTNDGQSGRNLSSSTVCTTALSYYLDKFCDKNNKSKLSIKDDTKQECDVKTHELENYYKYITDGLKTCLSEKPTNTKSSDSTMLEATDEFSLLNILSLLGDIRTNLKESERTCDDHTVIAIINILKNRYLSGQNEFEVNPHPFIYYMFYCILRDWKEQIKITDSELNIIHDKIYRFGKYELYRQLALHEANDRSLFDVKRLIYSLLIVTIDNKYSNNLIKDKVLDLIFNEQLDTGLWDSGHVINNDFVLENNKIIDKADRILSTTPILSSIECLNDMLLHDTLKTDLGKYQKKLNITYKWIIKRLRKINNPGTPSNKLLGWYPEYEPTHVPKSWVAGHTLIFLMKYCEFVSKLISRRAGKYLQIKESKELDMVWADLLNSYQIKEFFEFIINHEFSSALIYGPPGTGKSTIAKTLAKKLGWSYVELTPGLFLDRGEKYIIPKATEIFKRLIRMEKTVIFFDEVDQLVELRDEKSHVSSRWIVTSLLPKFQELRKQKDIKFILATNDITKVDPAIMRRGRIDFVLPMGGICWDDRLKILINSIKGSSITKNHIINAILAEEGKNKKAITNSHVEKFLQRTDFVLLPDIYDIVGVFKDSNWMDEPLFKLFFENRSNNIEEYENIDFKFFHQTIKENNIKLPSKIRGNKKIATIIEENVFEAH